MDKIEFRFNHEDLASINTRLLLDMYAYQRLTIDFLRRQLPLVTDAQINKMLSEHREEMLTHLYAEYGMTPPL